MVALTTAAICPFWANTPLGRAIWEPDGAVVGAAVGSGVGVAVGAGVGDGDGVGLAAIVICVAVTAVLDEPSPAILTLSPTLSVPPETEVDEARTIGTGALPVPSVNP